MLEQRPHAYESKMVRLVVSTVTIFGYLLSSAVIVRVVGLNRSGPTSGLDIISGAQSIDTTTG